MAGAGYKNFTSGDVLTAAQVNTYLMEQSTMVFATAAARTAGLATPTEGMVTTLSDTNRIEIYDGSAWKIVYQPPTAYTPTLTNAVRNTGQLYYSIAGNTMFIQGVITVTSVSGVIRVDFPTGFTYNSSSWLSRSIAGMCYYTVGVNNFYGTADYSSATQARMVVQVASGTYTSTAETSATVPATWTSGDKFTVNWAIQLA